MIDISEALNNKCDGSEQFHILTKEIASDISSKLKCYHTTETWGNYSYSNKITLYFNNNQPCVSKTDVFNRMLYILLSAKGPFFTLLHYLCKNSQSQKKVWEFATIDDLPIEILESMEIITLILNKRHLHFLNDKQLLEQEALVERQR